MEKYCSELLPNNTKKELYLTDLIKIAGELGYAVETIAASFDHVRGINTLKELCAAEHIKRSELIYSWMERGVHFTSAQTAQIDLNSTIGAGTCIEAGVKITAGSRIGENCTIEAFSHIDNSLLANDVHVKPYSIIKDSTIGAHTSIGPFAHIRTNSCIGTESIIGNFVEVSQSTVANKTKIKHLSYIGNATIGSEVNIGAGTVICNYNGATKIKSTTVIEDGALIGSNNSIIAPIIVAHHAMTAAGSTITNNVPEYALAIARARQVNKENHRTSSPFIATVKIDTPELHEES